MSLTKSKGNMYPFVSHTWNPIRGRCPHQCSYCYMKRYKVGDLRLVFKELKTNLGSKNFIFVGSSTDMFSESVYHNWIKYVLEHCRKYPENMYLFQSKNPGRFKEFVDEFPPNRATVLGTTIETNIASITAQYSTTPHPQERVNHMMDLAFPTMISIEPILEFDLKTMIDWIKMIAPEFVAIGADSKGWDLKEPSPEKVIALVSQLKEITKVKIKKNLLRIVDLDPN